MEKLSDPVLDSVDTYESDDRIALFLFHYTHHTILITRTIKEILLIPVQTRLEET